MKLNKLVLVVAVATAVSIAGCDTSDGPVEKAGENVDNAIDNAADSIEDAGDKIKEEVNP